MSRDRDAFLTSILSAPADDAPRVVYADWLDETGREDWRRHAEFIRVQCAIPRLADPDPMHPLRVRERQLEGYQWEWCGDGWNRMVRPWDERIGRAFGTPECRQLLDESPKYEMRRGFFETLTLTAADWLQHGDALSWSPEQTEPCKRCQGRGRPAVNSADWFELVCDSCNATGRAPRPMPATAQPLLMVRLTTPMYVGHRDHDSIRLGAGRNAPEYVCRRARFTLGEMESGHEAALRQALGAEWPNIKFDLPVSHPAPALV